MYLSLVALSLVYAYWSLISDPRNSAFAGLFFIILTLPWSLLLALVANLLQPLVGADTWPVFAQTNFNIMIVALGAIFNTILLFRAARHATS